MRLNVRQFIKLVESIFNLPEPIYEFGSLQVPGQEEIADLRPLFPGKAYTGCDIVPGKGVDRIENVESIKLASESVGTVIFVETIEHVKDPFTAVNEIHRVLKADGILVVTSAMDLPINNYPYDFWRFTPDSFKLLLSVFPQSIIGYQGYGSEPHTIFGIGFKDLSRDIVHSFNEFLLRSYVEIRTGNSPKSYKLKLAKLLMSLQLTRHRYYLYDVLSRYVSTENIHFEIVRHNEIRKR